MTRREALLALLLAFVLVAVGLTWLFGPYGLICSGITLVACILLGFERVGDGEAVEVSVPQRTGRFEV